MALVTRRQPCSERYRSAASSAQAKRQAKYDFQGDGWAEDLSVSLGATNVFDEDPPTYHGEFTGSSTGYAGFTLGRVVTLGISKAF